jgi:hypothetical protein
MRLCAVSPGTSQIQPGQQAIVLVVVQKTRIGRGQTWWQQREHRGLQQGKICKVS